MNFRGENVASPRTTIEKIFKSKVPGSQAKAATKVFTFAPMLLRLDFLRADCAGGNAVRRIHFCMLLLGISGLCGIGLLRGDSVTAQPELKPDTVRPATYSFTKKDTPKSSVPPPPEPVEIPSATDVMPPLAIPKVEVPRDNLPPLETTPTPKPLPVPVPVPTTGGEPPLVAPDEVKPLKPMPLEPIVAPMPMRMPEVAPRFEPARTIPGTPAPAAPVAAYPGNRVVPCLSLETSGPDTVTHGQAVTYEILVKNVGQVPVTHVRVEEELPAGTKFVSAEPAGEQAGEKRLWMLGSLAPTDEKRIKITVRPGVDGDLRTKPVLAYAASTQMLVKITRPTLTLTITGPGAAQVGDEVPVQIQISNTGNGDANKVTLKALLSDGLKHAEGKDIEAVLNRLAPGDSQTITLKSQAVTTGPQNYTLSAVCEGSAKATAKAEVQVTQPKLALTLTGPKKCMVRAEPTFTLEVGNPGTSATQPVQIAAALPPEGLDFLSASDGGSYDSATRTVTWNLGAAEAGSKRNLMVKTRSSSSGVLAIRAVAQAGPKLNARSEAVIAAEGVPALTFEVVNLENPIEVGKETTYEIRIVNTGTCPCTNIRVTAITSEGLLPGTATGPVPYKAVGQALHFDPIPKLGMKADAVIKVKAKGITAGDLRFKVQMSCDQLKQPIAKEESTSFFMQ